MYLSLILSFQLSGSIIRVYSRLEYLIFGFAAAILIWGQAVEVLCLFHGGNSKMFAMHIGI